MADVKPEVNVASKFLRPDIIDILTANPYFCTTNNLMMYQLSQNCYVEFKRAQVFSNVNPTDNKIK